jgi:hypothetical protein
MDVPRVDGIESATEEADAAYFFLPRILRIF